MFNYCFYHFYLFVSFEQNGALYLEMDLRYWFEANEIFHRKILLLKAESAIDLSNRLSTRFHIYTARNIRNMHILQERYMQFSCFSRYYSFLP
jgi:hypothetical protein